MSKALQRLQSWKAETAVVLGSGLSSIIPDAESAEKIPYGETGEIPKTSVPGHEGRFVRGKIDNRDVIFAQGRIHLYEGFSGREVTSIVRMLAGAGIKQLVLTNAAGSANPKFGHGNWMMMSDHINLTGTSPLLGKPEFVDMTDVYSPKLREQFRQAAGKIDIVLHEGVYAGLIGPQYETPSEVRMLQRLGADAVGMSTVLEAIQARALGLEVVGFSCLTNFAAGISTQKLSHEEVLATGKKAAADFARLLQAGLSN
jgi:purine-nucleoside phosphorylase